jgi:hypothetical protein
LKLEALTQQPHGNVAGRRHQVGHLRRVRLILGR